MKHNNLVPAFALALAALSGTVRAQSFPTQQIQMVVPFAAGGVADSMARSFAKGLSAKLGQQSIVINKDGAGGTIGFWQVARANANGYTLAYGPSTPVTAGTILSGGPKYDQLMPVCQTHENIMIVVVRDESPVKSIQQLLMMARAEPNKITYGHAGQGTVPHQSMENFGQAASISFVAVPYRGDNPMLTDLIGGTIDFGVSSAAAAGNGRLRVLAVFADQRQPTWPDAPAMREVGDATLAPGLNGLWAPKDTPAEVIALLEKECEAVVRTDEFQQAARALSQRPAFLGGKQYRERVVNDFASLERTIRQLNLSYSSSSALAGLRRTRPR
jgi:tripartite-type tricarboxylate transporter receptor subunit TctC